MRILGIETSCDETAVALYDAHHGLLAESIASQIETHAKFGGVVPEIASREHLTALPPMVDQVMQDARTSWGEIHTIAVTAGPGLMGALLVGVSYARGVGCVNQIPVLPVHHMEGHLFASGLSDTLPNFPFIALLVSGGHTMLVRVDAVGSYTLLGQTVDDAAGECFDKSARLLKLPYPGGPAISALAAEGDASRFKLPRPMLNKKNLNFSFSGLKTALMYQVRALPKDEQTRRDMAASLEQAIVDVLLAKTMRACAQEGISTLLIAGGVAANQRLRTHLAETADAHHINIHLPHSKHCTDNAAMIAYAGFLRQQAGLPIPETWDANPRWEIT